MIYLLRTSGINEKHEPVLILKIGYTDDSRGEGRFADYKSAGMDIEVLYKVQGGNIDLEHELQKRFHNFNLSWKSLEWFEDCPEIVNAFSGFNDIDNVANFLDYSSFDEFIESRKKINLKELYTESLNAVISDFGEDSSIVGFYRSFIDETRFDRRLECLCNFEDREKLFDYIPDKSFADFIRILGPSRCAAFSYRRNLLERELKNCINHQSVDVRSVILEKFNIEGQYWITSNAWFRVIVVATDVWKTLGYQVVVFLAAITSINTNLYEAAEMDGAGHWKKCLHITIPGIKPMITLMCILNIGNIMNAGFEQILVMYSPSVYATGDILDTMGYRIGLLGLDYSMGTAIGLFKSVISCICFIIAYRIAFKVADYKLF